MKSHPFTRPTVVAAVELLAAKLSQAKFDQVLVRLELDHEIPLGPGKSVTAKSALLASAVTRRSAHVINTLDGPMTLAEAAVRMAVQATMQDHEQAEQLRLLRGLALNGYVVSWNEGAREPMLRAALPGEVDLPACDDEVHQLLKQFGFAVPLGHLDVRIHGVAGEVSHRQCRLVIVDGMA